MLHAPISFYDKRLLRKLSFSLLRRYARVFKQRYAIERRMGVLMLLDQLDKVDMHLLCGGVWEPDRIAFLRKLIVEHKKPDDNIVFMDIGAHGGLYFLVLQNYIEFDRIIAYEPEPESLSQLYANLLMNNLLGKVEVIAKAVSDKEEISQFSVVEGGNRGESHLADSASGNGRLINVPVTCVDATFANVDTLLIAKIDVEGNENKVIAGMVNAIRNNRVILQVEKNTDDLLELERLLNSAGMQRIHSIDQDYYYVKA